MNRSKWFETVKNHILVVLFAHRELFLFAGCVIDKIMMIVYFIVWRSLKFGLYSVPYYLPTIWAIPGDPSESLLLMERVVRNIPVQ